VRKQATLVVSLLLLFAGAASAAAVTRALGPTSRVTAAIQHEKRLGPKPTPRWYWRWAQWRLGEGYARGHAGRPSLRPKQTPRRIPRWAWQRLHYFVLARSERALAAQRSRTGTKKHGPPGTTSTTDTTTATTTTTGTTTTTTPPPPPPPAGGNGDGVLLYGGNLTNVANPDHYSMVVGSAWSSDATSVVAQAAGLGLVYFNGTAVKTSFSTGVSYSQASANGWLLKDANGNYLVNSTYNSYAADLGSAAYQDAWITNVENYLAARPGIDGIFIDSVLKDPKSAFGTYPAKYPSTAAWSAATLSFVQAVYSALHAQGYYVALNAGAYKAGDSTYNDGTSTVDWWEQLGPHADGLMDEYYAEASNYALRASGSAWYQQWTGWQHLIDAAQTLGDDFLGLEYNGAADTAAMTYGKASFLLEWNGGRSVFMYHVKGSEADPTNSAWTTDIGTPAAAKVQVGVGWKRAYTGGTVLVNPSPSASQTFTVGGTSYTLGPTTARILASS
jgi:hypothetical protein